ncbi:hypothetical protein L345_02182, partial [Ophiophagus hannah]
MERLRPIGTEKVGLLGKVSRMRLCAAIAGVPSARPHYLSTPGGSAEWKRMLKTVQPAGTDSNETVTPRSVPTISADQIDLHNEIMSFQKSR